MSNRGDRTSESKICARCGAEYFKRAKYSRKQWAGSRFCSPACQNQPSAAGYFSEIHGRFYIRVNGHSMPRARFVFEQAFGPLPEGVVIHHINRDPTDDRLENLCVFKNNAGHMSFHALRGDCGFQLRHPKNIQRPA